MDELKLFDNFHLSLGKNIAETPEVEEQGGHVPPQVLGYQLTLFGPRGADYARHITTCPPIFLLIYLNFPEFPSSCMM